jgi:hypothetical protein
MRGKTNFVKWPVCVLFLVVTASTTGASEVIYVDAAADGINIGISWEHAVTSLQDGLLLAYFSEKPVEIRVAQGIYTPDRGLGIMPGDSGASFQLINGVTVKGGYAASLSGRRGEPDVRDINQYKSILSGDLNADDGPGLTNIEENSYHVVTSSENDATAVLDGFTITGSGIAGRGRSPYDHSSGMYNDKSSPTLIDCTFNGNLAAERGAGMYNSNSNAVLFNCTFSENDAPDGGAGMYNKNSSPMLINCTFSENSVGGSGAGMYNADSNPALLTCIFTGNYAGTSGGGMYNENSVPTLTNCAFTENSAGLFGGGGILNDNSSSKLADCVFSGNTTTGIGGGMSNRNASEPNLLNCIFRSNSAVFGGGMDNVSNSNPTLINCIFSGNSARNGGGMENLETSKTSLINCTFSSNYAENFGGGISNIQDANPMLVNCIFWDNTPEDISGPASVSYSNVEGGFPGEGNIDLEPLFADPENGDYHLKSQSGRWDPVIKSWVIDEITSPCIDAGNPDQPAGLERFPHGGRINMGAYGGTPEASLSPRQLPLLPGQASNPNPADGAVDVDVDADLTWTAGLDAVSHNVYFGPSINDMVLVSFQQTVTEFELERLDYGSTYYWRIDEVDGDGEIITGKVWTFITVPPPPPPKGRGCFLADTPVWVDGALVQISKVVAGQTIGKVTCPANTSIQIEKVEEHEETFVCYDVLLESGNCINVADCHYFLAKSGRWVALQNLKAGTKLQTLEGSIEISSVTKRPIPYVGKVYNIKVEDSDRYLVGEDAVIVRDY